MNSLSPENVVLLSSLIAREISKNLTSGEIDYLGNLFSCIGQNLSTIASGIDLQDQIVSD